MTKMEIGEAVEKAIRTGRWMVRSDKEGSSHNGFHWNAPGEWTFPQFFSDRPICQDGLFGQARQASGFPMWNTRAVFCETGAKRFRPSPGVTRRTQRRRT